MSVIYQSVQWNRQKKIYDYVLLGGLLTYIFSFVLLGLVFRPQITAETLLIRALGTAAFGLLHVILAIGPLCRLDRRFLPLLYNRRHMGVSMFVLGLLHGAFSLVQFHALGDTNPLVSLFTSNTHYNDLVNFPFQTLGFAALIILLLMASTSHDFWLKNLSPVVWKALHMAVYGAYGLIVCHVALGVLQWEKNILLWAILLLGFVLIASLHIAAALKEKKVDQMAQKLNQQGWQDVCSLDEIPMDRAAIAVVGDERVAVFRHAKGLSAVSNVCQHQNGPLGEGKVIDGCITCPWHGYQYRPEDGCSPAPFKEKVATYELKLIDQRVYVNPEPKAPGTSVEPLKV